MSKVEPKDRNIAMVFQSYALYPSMTVKENIIFGLKQAKTPKEKIAQQLQKLHNFHEFSCGDQLYSISHGLLGFT